MASRRRPTMRDVATLAGVSFKTVSRVVNEEGGVSPALVERVQGAVHELDYQPDQRARQLRSTDSRVGAIGCIISDVANPFFGSLLRGVEDVASERDSLVVGASTGGSRTNGTKLVEMLVRRRLDGLIVVPFGPLDGTLAAEVASGHPVVFADREVEGRQVVDVARTDHLEGARNGVRHLVEAGHSEIAYLGDDLDIFSAGLRYQGFTDVMAQAGLDIRTEWVVTATDNADGWFERARTVFGSDEIPTAVFTAQNFVTRGCVRALHHVGLQHRVAQVGFDDLTLADVLEPALTVVAQDPRAVGREAAELLFERIEGSNVPPRVRLLGTDLVVRGSGEIRPS